MLWCLLQFPHKNDVLVVFTPICFVGGSCFIHVTFFVFVFIYVYWCPTRFPYQMMFVLLNSNSTGANSGAGTAYTFPKHPTSTPYSSEVRVAWSLIFSAVMVDYCSSFCHCIICPSIYNFWLLLKYLQTFLIHHSELNLQIVYSNHVFCQIKLK